MRVKTFISNSATEIDKQVNDWLNKNNAKITLHDIKVQYASQSGKLVYVVIYNHYAVENIED